VRFSIFQVLPQVVGICRIVRNAASSAPTIALPFVDNRQLA
jgi:hypothetical protein